MLPRSSGTSFFLMVMGEWSPRPRLLPPRRMSTMRSVEWVDHPNRLAARLTPLLSARSAVCDEPNAELRCVKIAYDCPSPIEPAHVPASLCPCCRPSSLITCSTALINAR